MTSLILATRNDHKLREIRTILGTRFGCISLNDFPNAPTIREDAATFSGNATKKSVQIAEWLARISDFQFRSSTSNGTFVLADDSGLEVDALGGAPGVYSARFATEGGAIEGNSPDAANNAKLLRLLERVPLQLRQARFRCVIALTPVASPSAENSSPVCLATESELQTELFEGVCEGTISFAPRGRGGFGYDPLFVPNGFEVSFAELGEETKNQLSHRAQALAKLRDYLSPLSLPEA